MTTRIRKVYYCDFCKKFKKFWQKSVEKHERCCIMNPERFCFMCKSVDPVREKIERYKFSSLMTPKKFREAIDEIGCPACILACIRQSSAKVEYDYKEHSRIYRENRIRLTNEWVASSPRDNDWISAEYSAYAAPQSLNLSRPSRANEPIRIRRFLDPVSIPVEPPHVVERHVETHNQMATTGSSPIDNSSLRALTRLVRGETARRDREDER